MLNPTEAEHIYIYIYNIYIYIYYIGITVKELPTATHVMQRSSNENQHSVAVKHIYVNKRNVMHMR